MESVVDFEDLKQVESLIHFVTERRKFLGEHMIACPKCRDKQVQLLEIKMLPEWKCRICKHKFIYEPLNLIKE